MSAILLGNGLNRCLPNYPSWDSLLCNIGNEFFSPITNESNPLLRYDMMICGANREYASNEIDSKLIELLSTLNVADLSADDSDFLAKILTTGVKTVLTTNYDHNLETAITGYPSSPYANEVPQFVHRYETVASNKRHTRIEDIAIHHVHGELKYPKSICLGITKYVDNLVKTIELLSCDVVDASSTNLQRLIDEKIFSRVGWERTWAELLFNTDIYIVGLGLSECELDLWWLLLRRAQLLSYNDTKTKITNRIVYFPLQNNGIKFDFSRFETLHINVKPQIVSGSNWKGAYLNIWKEIERLEKTSLSTTARFEKSA